MKERIWSYLILLKVRKLAHYLTRKKEKLDFVKPEYEIERIGSYDIRQKILNISYVDWKKLGFSKGTLHYMKQNARSDKSFTFNSHVLERVDKLEALVQVKSKCIQFYCKIVKTAQGNALMGYKINYNHLVRK